MVWVAFATYTDVSTHVYSGGYVESHAERHVESRAAKHESDANDVSDASAA